MRVDFGTLRLLLNKHSKRSGTVRPCTNRDPACSPQSETKYSPIQVEGGSRICLNSHDGSDSSSAKLETEARSGDGISRKKCTRREKANVGYPGLGTFEA